MSAIFLLSVCLTYWPRKYTTRVDPHIHNSHQVWSWYDHTLPSYSALVCWYVTWPRDLDLWRFDLEQLSFMASHVTNLAIRYEVPMPIRSWVTSYNVSLGYHWKCVCGHCACAESRERWIGGQKQLHFWNPRSRFAYSLYNFVGSTMKIIKVICENNTRPVLKKRTFMRFCACAKSRVLLKMP